MKKTLIYCIMFLLLGTVSCKNHEISQPNAIFDNSEMLVENGAGKFTMFFTSNVNWTASVSESWLKVSPDYGSGTLDKYLDVSYKVNEDAEKRSADIIFTSADGTMELGRKTVTQTAAGKVIDTPSLINLPIDGGAFTVSVTHNVAFDVQILCDWITRVESKGITTTDLEFLATENREKTEREGVIVIGDKDLCDSIRIVQACGSSAIPLDPALLKTLLPIYDTDGDRAISYFEAKEIKEIVLTEPNSLGIPTGKGASTLKGVEYLPCLETIIAGRNAMSDVDLSGCPALKYVDLSYNFVTKLLLPASLEHLECSHNQISSLDLSGCENLEYLDCGENSLTGLDVTACSKLKTLCFYNNNISKIDLSNNTKLERVVCYLNNIETLDLSNSTGLVSLNCSYNNIRNLGISAPATLVTLECPGNLISGMNLSGYSKLRSLGCDHNQLYSLDVSGCTSLINLYAWHNNISTIDASGLTKLQNFSAGFNLLSSLNVSGCTSLKGLFVQDNRLTSLDISGLTELLNVYCHDNRITEIRMDGCENLWSIEASRNSLTSLDLTKCKKLVTLYTTGNKQLKEIQVPKELNPSELYWYKDEDAIFKSAEVTVSRDPGKWEAGSTVAVMNAGGKSVNTFSLISGEGQSKATFAGANLSPDKQMFAVWPMSCIVAFDNTTASVRLPSSYSYTDLPDLCFLAGKSSPAGGEVSISKFNSYIKLNVTGSKTLSSVVVSASSGKALSGDFNIDLASGNTMTVKKEDDAVSVSAIDKALSSTPVSITIPVASGTARKLDINLYDSEGKGMMLKDISCDVLTAGATTSIDIAYVPQDTDINLSSGGYANSYIVSAVGKYSFSARKVDGSALTGVRADWLWKSDATIISDVSYKAGTIFFSASGAKGNAGIALLDNDGNVVWSWHIWCTDRPKECKWNAHTWLDRNLGATSSDVCAESYGFYYQWGRKDPFMGSNIMGTSAAAGKDITLDGNTIVNTDVVGAGNGWKVLYGESTMENATRYPLCFYAYVTDGSYTNPADAYGGKTTYYGNYNATVHPYLADWLDTKETFSGDRWYNTSVTSSGKTNYDPCPPGYQVPPKPKSDVDMTREYFPLADPTTAGNTGGQFGPNGYWLPAPGIRGAGSNASQGGGTPNDGGQLWRVGQYGIYWTATSNTAYCNAWQFNVTVKGIDVGNSSQWKAYGFPIRCVSETK